ncbi:DNA-methyltransferase [Providencia sp. PROV099]|uniref:DNA-methyltransferase n=1 Tax=Providencia sp. PROV099 TaxID=2949815 RepID=UPI00234AAD48|nr:site-specific DNA-methyltransferase [Providencia sp. PROV099]WOB97714.1 site-specific DNA-methyltransferase [Providencia sp. PROV099]
MIDDLKRAYYTNNGAVYEGDSLKLLDSIADNSINLIITSPPFALQRKKEYGNHDQDDYIDWFIPFAEKAKRKLTDDGSFVIDFGGAYKKGMPVRSLYNFKILIELVETVGFHLAEDFYWFNPSKLPSPIEWVNKRKLRVKDSVNTIWWLSKTPWPKSDVTKVLSPYSEKMKKLIDNPEKYYTPKMRPSGHDIGSSFGKDNGGAIPPNLLQIPNSESNSGYLSGCKKVGVKSHPARFPAKLPEFFIKMLTDENDIVLDIFGGSNTTGMVAENLNRKWITFEKEINYIATSAFRFFDKGENEESLIKVHDDILSGNEVKLNEFLVKK